MQDTNAMMHQETLAALEAIRREMRALHAETHQVSLAMQEMARDVHELVNRGGRHE